MACSHDVQRGQDAYAIGDYERSKFFWNRVLDTEPTHREARLGLAMVYLALAEQRESERVEASEEWLGAWKELRVLLSQDSSQFVRQLAVRTLLRLGHAQLAAEQFSKAKGYLKHVVRLDSTHWEARNLYCLVQEGLGEFRQALQCYQNIVRQHPFVPSFINLGNLYWSLEDYQAAGDAWQEGLQHDPQNTYLQVWFERANQRRVLEP